MRKLSGAYYFSKIDLADAYNQIKLGPESQKRLALSTHRRILLQTRLPFGISSAPGYFQEIMDQLTRDLSGVAVYLDDLLVSGANAEEHLQNLQALLQRLQDKGLRCNLEKCCFAQSSVEYLGHTLSRDGTHTVIARRHTHCHRPTAHTPSLPDGTHTVIARRHTHRHYPTAHTPSSPPCTPPPNPPGGTASSPRKKRGRRKIRIPQPDAEYGTHSPRQSERLQSRK